MNRLIERIQGEVVSFEGKMAIYLHDFSSKPLMWRGNMNFELASAVKSYILLDLFEKAEDGKIDVNSKVTLQKNHICEGSGVLKSLTPGLTLSIRDFATLMIIVSDNSATNLIIDLLGVASINKTIEKYGFTNTVLHNPIDFDKYEKLGTGTVGDYGKFFSKLYKKELVSKKACEEMIDIFSQQHYNSMLIRDFPHYYLAGDDSLAPFEERITVASKSGSMDQCRVDGGLIMTGTGAYVICIFTKDFKDPLYYYDHRAQQYSSKVSRLVLDAFIDKGGTFL